MDKDRFIASMTFASHFGACDCDECEIPTTAPTSIQEAVQLHKRQRLLYDTIAATVTQKRSLVARSMSNISIWHLTLPPGTEPLTELGGSHRIVVIDSMPKDRVVKMIGKGIVGSRDEENSRKVEDWTSEYGYFYKSNGGKAIGWVNEKTKSDEGRNVSDTSADVVLYVIKATKETVESANTEESMDESTWGGKVLHIFQKYTTIENSLHVHESSQVSNPKDSRLSFGPIELKDLEVLKGIIASLTNHAEDSNS